MITSLLLSCLLCCVCTIYLNNKIIAKYAKYKHNHLKIMLMLSVAANIALQYKLLNINSSITRLSTLCFLLVVIISSCLSISTVIDILYHELPDEMNLLILISMLPIAIYFYNGHSLITGLIVFVGYFLLASFRDDFGMGDAKFAFATGIGIRFALMFKFVYMSFLLASVFAVILICVDKFILKKNVNVLRKEMAFGPYIALSFVIFF